MASNSPHSTPIESRLYATKRRQEALLDTIEQKERCLRKIYEESASASAKLPIVFDTSLLSPETIRTPMFNAKSIHLSPNANARLWKILPPTGSLHESIEQAAILDLTNANEKLKKDNKKLRMQLEAEIEKAKNRDADATMLELRLREKEDVIENTLEKYSHAQKKTERIHERLQSMEKEIEKLHYEKNELSKRLVTLNATVEARDTRVQELRNTATQSIHDRLEAVAKLTVVQNENVKANEDALRRSRQFAEMMQNLETCKTENARLQVKMNSLLQHHKSMTKEIDDLQSKNRCLEEQLSTLFDLKEKADKFDGLLSELTTSRSQIVEKNTLVDIKTEEISCLKESLSECEARFLETQRQLHDATKEQQRLEKIACRVNKLDTVVSENDRIQSNLEQKIKETLDSKLQVEHKLHEIANACNKLRKVLVSTECDNTYIGSEHDSSAGKFLNNENLADFIMQAMHEISRLRVRHDDMVRQLTSFEEALCISQAALEKKQSELLDLTSKFVLERNEMQSVARAELDRAEKSLENCRSIADSSDAANALWRRTCTSVLTKLQTFEIGTHKASYFDDANELDDSALQKAVAEAAAHSVLMLSEMQADFNVNKQRAEKAEKLARAVDYACRQHLTTLAAAHSRDLAENDKELERVKQLYKQSVEDLNRLHSLEIEHSSMLSNNSVEQDFIDVDNLKLEHAQQIQRLRQSREGELNQTNAENEQASLHNEYGSEGFTQHIIQISKLDSDNITALIALSRRFDEVCQHTQYWRECTLRLQGFERRLDTLINAISCASASQRCIPSLRAVAIVVLAINRLRSFMNNPERGRIVYIGENLQLPFVIIRKSTYDSQKQPQLASLLAEHLNRSNQQILLQKRPRSLISILFSQSSTVSRRRSTMHRSAAIELSVSELKSRVSKLEEELSQLSVVKEELLVSNINLKDSRQIILHKERELEAVVAQLNTKVDRKIVESILNDQTQFQERLNFTVNENKRLASQLAESSQRTASLQTQLKQSFVMLNECQSVIESLRDHYSACTQTPRVHNFHSDMSLLAQRLSKSLDESLKLVQSPCRNVSPETRLLQ